MKLFFLIIIVVIYIINTDDSNCSSYKDCFTCSICNDILLTECDCIWSNNSCEQLPSKLIYTKEWWNKFILCTDDSSKELQKLYCGEPYKEKEKSKNILITYSKVDSYYGKKFLYCNYEVTLDKKKKDFVTLKIKMGKLLGHNAPLIGISYEYETEYLYNHIYDVGTIKFDDIKIYNAQIIKIHLFSIIDYTSNPITIKFDYSKGSKKVIKIIFVILSLIIFLVIISFGVYYFNKNRKLNKNKELIRKIQIEDLIRNKFQTYIYQENNNNHLKCSHCKELIQNTDEVSKTLCNHIFHGICLKDYFQRNDFTCPDCNCNFREFVCQDYNYYDNNIRNNRIEEENINNNINNNGNDNNNDNDNNNEYDDGNNNNNEYDDGNNNNGNNNNNDNNNINTNYDDKKNEIINNVINNNMNNVFLNDNNIAVSKPLSNNDNNENNNRENISSSPSISNDNSVHVNESIKNNPSQPPPYIYNNNYNKNDEGNFPI